MVSTAPGAVTVTQVALLHVAVAGAEITQDRAQLGHIGLVLGVADVRFRDNLYQRDAGTVEVDKGHRRRLIVQRLAGILLQMQPLDADGGGLAALEFHRSRGTP
jgi:hypothetical protein